MSTRIPIIALLILNTLMGCSKNSDADTTQNELTDITGLASFEQNIANGVSLMFFHATWCTKCAAQRPAVEGLTSENALTSVTFGEVDYEKNRDITDRFSIVGFPTIVIYKDGLEVHRWIGQGHTQKTISDKLLTFL